MRVSGLSRAQSIRSVEVLHVPVGERHYLSLRRVVRLLGCDRAGQVDEGCSRDRQLAYAGLHEQVPPDPLHPAVLLLLDQHVVGDEEAVSCGVAKADQFLQLGFLLLPSDIEAEVTESEETPVAGVFEFDSESRLHCWWLALLRLFALHIPLK